MTEGQAKEARHMMSDGCAGETIEQATRISLVELVMLRATAAAEPRGRFGSASSLRLRPPGGTRAS